MKLKKPKFWDYKKPNIYAYLLLPITLLIKIINKMNFKNKLFIIIGMVNGNKRYEIKFGFL